MTISCCKWLKTAIHGGKTCGRLLLSRRMMMMNFKAKTSRVTGHTISIGVKTLKTLLHIALTRISLWKMLLFKLQFYQPSWFGAFGVQDTNIEDDELKVYLKWTLHVLIYCTQLHTLNGHFFVVQWHAHSPEVSVNIRTAKVVVLYLFTVTCIEIWCVRSLGRIKSSRLRSFFDDVPEKIACSGLLLSERLEQATEKKGMDLWKQMSSK